jgi:hypothetical protein
MTDALAGQPVGEVGPSMIAHARVVGRRGWLSLYNSTTTLAPKMAYCSSRRIHSYNSAADRSRVGSTPGLSATNTGSRVACSAGRCAGGRAATARWRTASGVASGHAQPWRVKALRSDGWCSALRGGVDAAELLGELEGAFGFGPVGEEAAVLPAHAAQDGQIALLVLFNPDAMARASASPGGRPWPTSPSSEAGCGDQADPGRSTGNASAVKKLLP